VARLQAAYAAIPPGSPIRLAKRTSNLFRFRDAAGARTAAPGHGAGAGSGAGTSVSPAQGTPGLDVSAFRRVLSVDPRSRTAVTGGMTTYEDLADATLRHGLMPLVVPQLKTITIGGAVTGLGIESSSLRSGMPHESVLEMEILTGDGRVVTAAPGNEHDALYRGFPNSYGTLGYALSLTIELEPVTPYVHLRHFRFAGPEACMDAVAQIARDGSYQGHRADFVDGTAFGPGELYLTVGAFSDVAPWRSDYTGQQIYYESVRRDREDFLTIRDYLWRWDTDWFWCSRPFGVQRPVIRRLWPRKYRRSDVYRKLVALDRRHGLSAALDRLRPIRPADHRTWLGLARLARLIVSDSCGVQEECTVLKKPLVVVRNSTERPESVEAGFAHLVRPGPLVGEIGRRLIADTGMAGRLAGIPCPYGDGKASERITAIARRFLA